MPREKGCKLCFLPLLQLAAHWAPTWSPSVPLLDCSPLLAHVQCCTCNMCGLGKAFDVILAAFGTAW